jgi:hypothetical protein
MEGREERLVNRWAGSGRLTKNGETIATVRYAIREDQTFHLLKRFGEGSGEEAPGLKRLVFGIDSRDLDLWSLSGVTVTLYLEDGRSVDLFHSGDRFVNSSQLRSPQ